MKNLKQVQVVDIDWEPEPPREWEPEYEPDWEPDYTQEDHLPVNWDWLDRMRAEYQASLAARQAAQKAPEPFTGLYLVPGGRVGKSHSLASLQFVPKPVAARKRYGLQAIIRIANELEYALNHIRRESDVAMLLEMEPHLRRVDQIARQLLRLAAKAHCKSKQEYSLFEE